MPGRAETGKRPAGRKAEAAARILGLVAACVFLPAVAISKQSTPQTLRVTTRLVVVNVVAHNEKGEPVKDLSRGDFTILDDGKPQQISVFSVERREVKHASVKPLPPNVFSNRIARDGSVPANVAAILFDGADTSFADSSFARSELAKFIRQMPLGESVALYVLGPRGLSIVQDFTSDPSPLLEAIRGLRGYAGAESASPDEGDDLSIPQMSARDALNSIMPDMDHRPKPGEIDPSRIMSGLEAVKAIASRLSGLPGRKSLIWVTDHVPYPGPQSFANLGAVLAYEGNISAQEQKLRKVIRALNQDDVAVYPVDAHGLVVGPLNKGLYASSQGLPPPIWPGEVWVLDMDYWAHHTGGRAFYFTNGLDQAIHKALDDSEVTYTLGYYPNGLAWNGEYRHIKVRVDRKGVHLRYRQGYYASTGAENLRAKPVNLLAAAAASPLDSTGLGVTVRLTRRGQPPSLRLKAAIYVDGRGLTFQPEHGRYDVSFMVWAGQYSKQGRQLAAKSKKVSFKLSPANYHAALKGGLGLTVQETLKPGAWKLGVSVLDTASGTTGSVRIPLHRQSGLGGDSRKQAVE